MSRALLPLTVLIVIFLCCACEEFGGTGPQRYKAELNTALLKLAGDIQDKGAVSAQTEERLRKLQAKYKDEFGTKQSYRELGYLIEGIAQLRAKPTESWILESIDTSRKSLEQTLRNEVQ